MLNVTILGKVWFLEQGCIYFKSIYFFPNRVRPGSIFSPIYFSKFWISEATKPIIVFFVPLHPEQLKPKYLPPLPPQKKANIQTNPRKLLKMWKCCLAGARGRCQPPPLLKQHLICCRNRIHLPLLINQKFSSDLWQKWGFSSSPAEQVWWRVL